MIKNKSNRYKNYIKSEYIIISSNIETKNGKRKLDLFFKYFKTKNEKSHQTFGGDCEFSILKCYFKMEMCLGVPKNWN